ncbi:MAG: DNA mismatch endonuclease Vsr [Acidobacteria bacterium]|nr:DNA mismatch endonuclease Vsr [Acidobacteriota bacterium]
MVDVLSPSQRARNMAAIKGRDTQPEILVRKIVHSLGYRYRLSPRNLPGKPDIVLAKHRKVILIHRCFWHVHSCRYGQVRPKTNEGFWETKRTGNVARDRKTERMLKKAGWKVLTIWECETKISVKLKTKLIRFLVKTGERRDVSLNHGAAAPAAFVPARISNGTIPFDRLGSARRTSIGRWLA